MLGIIGEHSKLPKRDRERAEETGTHFCSRQGIDKGIK